MDVWDYYYRQNEIAFSHKVSDAALTCLKININSGPTHHSTSTGKLVAVGDQDGNKYLLNGRKKRNLFCKKKKFSGTVTVLELCESLYVMQPKEKDIINEVTFNIYYVNNKIRYSSRCLIVRCARRKISKLLRSNKICNAKQKNVRMLPQKKSGRRRKLI
jgi:hypothetical protein